MRLGVIFDEDEKTIIEKIEFAKKFTLIKGIGITPADIDFSGGEEQTLGLFRRHAIEPAQIGVWDFNPLFPTDESMRSMEKAIRFSGRACGEGYYTPVNCGAGGHNRINMFLGDPRDSGEDTRKRIAEHMKPLARLAEQHNARIALEPSILTAAYDAQSSYDIIARISSPNVGINIDLFNYTSLRDAMDSSHVMDVIFRTLHGKIFSAHLKDARFSSRICPAVITVSECHPGEGTTDYPALLKNIAHALTENQWALIEHIPFDAIADSYNFILLNSEKNDIRFL